jgi:branched-chain amino acid transport system substrate-binding protein
MKKFSVAIGLFLATALSVTAAAVARDAPATAPQAGVPPAATEAVACRARSIGIMAPLTGQAAFLGQEQLSWTRFAIRNFNRQFGTRFRIVLGDSQLSASLARTVGRRLISNRNVMGVVGGSTSQSVISSAGLFAGVKLASVSGSATRVDLTNGQFPTFFRVVPHDGVQAPTIANYVAGSLRARQVVIIDSQDDYSTALAAGIQPLLEAKRPPVQVARESVSNTTSDFSSVVSRIGNNVDVVIFATQTAAFAQTLSQQLREQGKRAVVFGTDGAYSPAQFRPVTGFVSSFANDLHFVSAAQSIVRQYNQFSGGKTFGTFGPPSYMAAWVLLRAMNTACRDGKITRAEVTANVRRTNIPSILGGSIRFTAKGDVVGAKFYVFRITNGTYQLVG